MRHDRSYRLLVIEVSLALGEAFSLKDKRRLRLSLCQKLSQRFRLSVLEWASQDDYRRLQLVMSYTALSEGAAEEMAAKIEEFLSLELLGRAEIEELWLEIL